MEIAELSNWLVRENFAAVSKSSRRAENLHLKVSTYSA